MPARPGQLLWRALESVPGLCCTAGEWRQLLAAEYAGAAHYLRADGRLATSCPCPAKPECGCIHRVVRHGADRFVGVCVCEPPRCSRHALARGDLALVRVDTTLLATDVAACLGIEPRHEAARGLASTWGLGTYRPRPGIDVSAFLSIQVGADGLEQAVLGLSASAGSPFALVVPTRRLLRATSDTLLRRAGGHVIALSEEVSLADDGSLAARRPLDSIWAPCHARASGAARLGSRAAGPREDRVGGRAVALSRNAERLLSALRKHARKPWPGSATLCRDAGVPSGAGRIAPMHRTAFARAVRELVDEGIVDLKGNEKVRKGYNWDLLDGQGAQTSRKS